MVYFYGFIAVVLLIMALLLFYNEIIKNENLLLELQQENLKLTELINSAKSQSDCNTTDENKADLNDLEAQLEQNKKIFNKTFIAYSRQYKVLSFVFRKTKLKKPVEFK